MSLQRTDRDVHDKQIIRWVVPSPASPVAVVGDPRTHHNEVRGVRVSPSVHPHNTQNNTLSTTVFQRWVLDTGDSVYAE